ncbi:unnamed protein product [Arctogadus glacialis]
MIELMTVWPESPVYHIPFRVSLVKAMDIWMSVCLLFVSRCAAGIRSGVISSIVQAQERVPPVEERRQRRSQRRRTAGRPLFQLLRLQHHPVSGHEGRGSSKEPIRDAPPPLAPPPAGRREDPIDAGEEEKFAVDRAKRIDTILSRHASPGLPHLQRLLTDYLPDHRGTRSSHLQKNEYQPDTTHTTGSARPHECGENSDRGPRRARSG